LPSEKFLKIPAEPLLSGPMPKLSLIVPTYNEKENIKDIVRIICGLLDKKIPDDYELIIVDDDSPDNTWQIAQSLIGEYPHLRVVRRQNEKGLATAVIRGWQEARGQILGVMDGDLQHPPSVLADLLDTMDKGVDLAVASRHTEGGGVSDWSMFRRIISRSAQVLGLVLLPGVLGRVSDPMSGYFMIRRTAIAEYPLSPVGYKILIEVLARGNIARIGEAGYVFQERVKGGTKATPKIFLEYIVHILKLRISLWPYVRFIKFCTVGATGVFVDTLFLFLLSDPKMLGLGLTRSKIISAELALISNFIINDFWTFGDISQHQPGLSSRLKRFGKFNVICFIGILLSVIILNILFNMLGMNRYIANLFAIAISTLWNFWMNYKLGWRVAEFAPKKK